MSLNAAIHFWDNHSTVRPAKSRQILRTPNSFTIKVIARPKWTYIVVLCSHTKCTTLFILETSLPRQRSHDSLVSCFSAKNYRLASVGSRRNRKGPLLWLHNFLETLITIYFGKTIQNFSESSGSSRENLIE